MKRGECGSSFDAFFSEEGIECWIGAHFRYLYDGGVTDRSRGSILRRTLVAWAGARRSHQLLSLVGQPLKLRKGFAPDFLWTLAALANLIRLSSLKAAHAVVNGAAY
jgi:hypothetical protein